MTDAFDDGALVAPVRAPARDVNVIKGSAALDRIARESALGESTEQRFPEHRVDAELQRQYQLAGELIRIPTEKDDTFRLDADVGRFLVKIAPATETAQIVNLQSAVMLHLEKSRPPIRAQRLIRGVHGQVESSVIDPGGRTRIMRVMSYLDGALLSSVTPSTTQFQQVGATLARLDTGLINFRHPGESRSLIWDLKNFMHMRPLLELVNDRDDVTMASWIFDQFDALVAPRLGTLATQMIHGDFSPFNVVVDPTADEFVVGVIDFGDVVRSPVVFELAVAVANHIGIDDRRPWDSALEIVRGYRAVRPMSERDVALLAIAGPARLLLRALIFGWRAAVDPRSRDYGLSHSARDWSRLRSALSMATPTVQELLSTTAASPTQTGAHRR
ncbi:phosphotransferase [Mycobacterium sp. PSTR-4-N]|uniref:phosphotransferase n=1 Tax=Mycobacterium sp. PSTR-4-N TaxID=2917745 RepID=UPI001F154EC2|nr:phosphotransferase [Mycobacterium sp. PSTR-4-N]MCG7596772.1 phosphotransferase [Mycobacterium sp. PSTR-4-N]